MASPNVDIQKILKSCQTYDLTPQEVESCFPKSISHIKRLYGLLRKCNDNDICNGHGAGFTKSFLLAIEEANTRFESDLDEYLTEIKKIKSIIYHDDDDNSVSSIDYDGMEKLFQDKQLYKLYVNYYKTIDKMQAIMILDDKNLSNVPINALENMLNEFTDAALSLCLYLNSQDDAKDLFKGNCSEFKTKRK